MLSQTSMFVHPQFAMVALASAALPVLIHLINRRRYRRQPWAAMSFLLAAGRRTARRIRLEQWLLLLIRMVLIALFGLAVARPFLPALPLASLGRSRTHHILLVDNSCSMSARDRLSDERQAVQAATRFDRAIQACEELLSTLPTGDAVSLVTLASPARPAVGHAAYDRRTVRDRLKKLRVTQRSTDVAGGLSEALSILAKSEFAPQNRVVYIIGDTPASIWLVPDPPKGGGHPDAEHMPGGAAIELARRVANEAVLVFVHIGSNTSSNIAITDIRVSGGVAGAELPLQLSVDVGNFSDRTLGAAGTVRPTLQVSIDDRIVRSVPLEPIGASESHGISFSLAMSSPGSHVIKVAIDVAAHDVLPIDNTRLLAIDALEAMPVLLVDGHPAVTPLGGNAGYLSTALAPRTGAGETTMFSPRTVSDREFALEPLCDYRVIVLCNVPRLDAGDWGALENFVRDGGGLLVFGGDSVDAVNYNEHGYRDGAGVLPCRLGDLVGDPQAHDQFVRLAPGSFTHPALLGFSENADSGLFLARIHRFVAVEPTPVRAEVALRYTDGHPALVFQSFGKGLVALVTTSADMSWTNLPAKGDYVSLIVELVTYLAPSSAAHRTLVVGDMVNESLGAHEPSFPLRVTDPDGSVGKARLLLTSGAFSLEYGPIEQVGTYRVSIGPREVTYVGNIDGRESSLRSAGERNLRDALNCPFTYVGAADLHLIALTRKASSEFGPALLYAVLALLVLETWLAGRFGAYR